MQKLEENINAIQIKIDTLKANLKQNIALINNLVKQRVEMASIERPEHLSVHLMQITELERQIEDINMDALSQMNSIDSLAELKMYLVEAL